MSHLETAFVNLEFALKLRAYVQDGHIDWQKLDHGFILESEDRRHRINLERPIFKSEDDLLTLVENNCTIAFGVAAITLNRNIEIAKYARPAPENIATENQQCIECIAQIRHAFAHDMAEPKWKIDNRHRRRIYEFGRMKFDLTDLHGQNFKYEHLNGIEGLFDIRNFAIQNLSLLP